MSHNGEIKTLSGFVQQIAVSTLPWGYWWYVSGWIPAAKDPAIIDAKLIAKYDITASEATRWRRKQRGISNIRYYRHGRQFVLFFTKGNHVIWTDEQQNIRDIRKAPFRVGGYSISYRPGGRTRKGERDPKWHSHVQIDLPRYKEIKAHFLAVAKRKTDAQLGLMFYELPFEPYAPVRRQFGTIWREVNRIRKKAKMSHVPLEVLPMRRRIVRVQYRKAA